MKSEKLLIRRVVSSGLLPKLRSRLKDHALAKTEIGSFEKADNKGSGN